MKNIKKIIIGTNNNGKYKEICALLPKRLKIFSPKKLKILSPKEIGASFEENSAIKASYFSKKTNLVCLADDSGLEIDVLGGEPGIYSARWGGKKNNFDLAIKKVLAKILRVKKKYLNNKKAKFICCLTLFWPNGKIYSCRGEVKGSIILEKRGLKGFGYDPIFVPNGYKKTFSEMDPFLKMSIDHRYKAYAKLKNFFI